MAEVVAMYLGGFRCNGSIFAVSVTFSEYAICDMPIVPTVVCPALITAVFSASQHFPLHCRLTPRSLLVSQGPAYMQ